jgi:hypothetical protein
VSLQLSTFDPRTLPVPPPAIQTEKPERVMIATIGILEIDYGKPIREIIA